MKIGQEARKIIIGEHLVVSTGLITSHVNMKILLRANLVDNILSLYKKIIKCLYLYKMHFREL